MADLNTQIRTYNSGTSTFDNLYPKTKGELVSTSALGAGISNVDAALADLKNRFYIGDQAPSNTNLIWIDTGNNNAIKFYKADSSSWVGTSSVWG